MGMDAKEVEINTRDKKHVNQTHLLMLTATLGLPYLTLRISFHRDPVIQTVSQSLITQTVSLHAQHTLPTPITQIVSKTPAIPAFSLATPNPII